MTNLNCRNILKWTEAQLKYNFDVALKDATPRNSMRRWVRR